MHRKDISRLRALAFVVFVGVVMTGCVGGRHHRRSLLTPAASGTPYEVMVVADNDVWIGRAGRALDDVLNTPIPMLPQQEPTFHVSRVDFAHYNRITNLFRNIIVLQQNSHYTKPKISIRHNVYSEPQAIMTIQGPDLDELAEYITSSRKIIIQYFYAEEVNRYATDLEDRYNKAFYDKCREMFGCEFCIPADINKMKVGKDFIWASNDGISTIQSICIYSYPYVSEKVFSRHSFIGIRDKFMRENIPGEHEGEWMQTNPEFVSLRDINSRGVYIQEARGLWTMRNAAMGGPFVSHSLVDTLNGRIVVAEAFVYAPQKMKRTMIRRLEAALFTLRLPGGRMVNEE